MKPWYWVITGGVFETAWALAMKMSDGFRDLFWDAVTVVFILISVYFLNRGLKAGLPMGTCYAVWVGIGAILATIAGLIIFDETLGVMGWICLAVVVGGIIGINLVSQEEHRTAVGFIYPLFIRTHGT